MNALQIAGLVVGAGSMLDVAADRPTWGPVGLLVGAGLFGTGTWAQRQAAPPGAPVLPVGPPIPAPVDCVSMGDHEYCIYQASVDREAYYYAVDGGDPVLGGTFAQAINRAKAEIMAMPDW